MLRRTPRLTYRRRGGRWSANKIYKLPDMTERKARAAVRCRRLVKLHGPGVVWMGYREDASTL